jgi:hypothetical protein
LKAINRTYDFYLEKANDLGWRRMKRTDFLKLIEDCQMPDKFDQKLLDDASSMMKKWGDGLVHVGADKEHLFKSFGLSDKAGDSETTKKEKAALRCLASKIFKSEIRKEDAIGIMKNLNGLNGPGFRWLE